jgi:NAD-dependent dihydropyrimidine dehydrogenase PreA subunit
MKRKAITPIMRLVALQKARLQADCYVCRRTCSQDGFQFDHVQALVDGGAHDPENIAVICLWCHREKSAFEHQRNSKSKRLAQARAAHEAVVGGEPKKPGTIKSRGFDRTFKKKLNGKTERRQEP